jgi:hypothetical protein
MSAYAQSVEHMAAVYSLGAPDDPFLRERRRAEFLDWLAGELSKAWDEGFNAGEIDVWQHETFDEPCISNPYRKGEA